MRGLPARPRCDKSRSTSFVPDTTVAREIVNPLDMPALFRDSEPAVPVLFEGMSRLGTEFAFDILAHARAPEPADDDHEV